MSRAHRWSVLLPLLWAGSALANGGGYSFGVSFTGSLAPFQAVGTEKVRILEEKLDIVLHRAEAAVVVRYAMQNLTSEPVTVRFGFPVEATALADGEETGFEDLDSLTPAQRRQRLVQGIQQLKGYSVALDGAPVKSVFEVEPFATGRITPFPGSGALKKIAGWMVSEVTFPTSASLNIEIRYSADYMGDVMYVSDDTRKSPLSFVYRLSTGAVWNGSIGRGTVTVTADGTPADEVEIIAPRESFKRDGGRWTWTFQDLEPTLADDISIKAAPGYFRQGFVYEALMEKGVRSYLERMGAWGEGHQRFKARASSTLAPAKDHDFRARHLAEAEPVAPWCDGVPGLGIGEWVELTPTRPSRLLALEITPGFWSQKKKALFEVNARPARVEVLLNGEHRFTAELADKPYSQLIPVIGYDKPVTGLKITILEVRRGTKYDDTCISGVVLYDRLAAKPAVQPAR